VKVKDKEECARLKIASSASYSPLLKPFGREATEGWIAEAFI
jgi:hypothetical protein